MSENEQQPTWVRVLIEKQNELEREVKKLAKFQSENPGNPQFTDSMRQLKEFGSVYSMVAKEITSAMNAGMQIGRDIGTLHAQSANSSNTVEDLEDMVEGLTKEIESIKAGQDGNFDVDKIDKLSEKFFSLVKEVKGSK